jgi:hypothetical protein
VGSAMRRTAPATALLALAMLLLVPSAQAAINGSHDFEATLTYQKGLSGTDGNFTLLSGAMDATITDAHGPYGFFQVKGARLDGLSRVCFQTTCLTSNGGTLALDVAPGGSFGLQLPTASSGQAGADHVLGILVDFNNGKDLNSFKLGKTLMAPSIAGTFDFTTLPSIPRTDGTPTPTAGGNAGGFVALDDKTQVRVLDGGTILRTFPAGKQDPVAFQGQPRMTTLQPGLMVLPFESGSTMHLERADQDAADVGLDVQRIASLGTNLNQASRVGAKADAPELNFGPLEPLLPHLLNGALLRLPTRVATGVNPASQFGYVRFTSLDASSSGNAVDLSGPAPLEVQDGQIVDASPLLGFAIFQMPWWSYLLWGIGIFLFVARLIVKPAKEHPLDRFRWVGFLCSVVLFLLFLWLWDLEVQEVWGVSMLSGTAPGDSMLVVAAMELMPLFAVLFAVVAPARLILKNAAFLAGRGRLMGLPAAFAYPIGYILGAPLLLAYLNVGLKTVAGT